MGLGYLAISPAGSIPSFCLLNCALHFESVERFVRTSFHCSLGFFFRKKVERHRPQPIMSLPTAPQAGGSAAVNQQRLEERSVILHVGALLHSLTARWNGVSVAGVSAMHNEMAMDAPQIAMRDACDLTTMISQVVSNARRDPGDLRAVLFEAHPQLLAILLSLLQAPQSAVPDDSVAVFLVSLLNTLTDIVCATCQETSPQEENTDSLSDAGSWQYLRNMMIHALRSQETVPLIVGMLNPALPESVQQSAAEFLFALLARVDEARIATAHTSCFGALYNSLSEQQSPTLRAFVAACIRELANTQAEAFWENAALMETLIRLIPLDEAPDVRALAAETLETVMQQMSSIHGQRAVTTFARLRELSAAIVDRLEAEDIIECQIAVLKLTETLLDLEKSGSSEDADLPQRTSSTKPSRSFVSTFSEYLLSSYGDRLLVQLLQPNSRVGSLAARCLRLLIQVAPFYRFAAFGLVQHFPSLSKMLKLCVTLASDLDGNRDVVTQVVRVETSLAVTLCLAQDPRARQLLDSQLIEHPHYTSQLRSALLSNLNSAALDYYEDVFIIDAVGDLITHVDAVEWETVGPMSPIATAARPTKQSVSELFERQEHKWSTSPALDDHIDAGQRQHHLGNRRMQLQTTRPVSDLQRAQLQRLAFILVTYAAHRTLGQHLSSQAPRSHSSQTYDESPMVDVSPISAAWVPPTESGPVPTRSSMLREWGAHPHKAGAVMRAAETIRESGQTTMNYASDSFAVASGRTEVLSATGAAKVVPRQGAPQQRRTTQQNISIQYTNTARRVSPHRSGSVAHRTTTTRRYTKFDHALKLAMQFAQYFRGAGSGGGAATSSVQAIATFETNGNGFARRVPQSQTTASSSHQDPSSSLGPGSLPPPSSSQQRSWSVDQLKEGDLFFFSLQILDVSHHSLEQVRARAIRHLNVIKKAFVVTPQAAKSRRWFLFDMATHILPGIIHVISQLIELFVLHGDETAKFPIVLFREQALRDEEGDHGNGAASSSELHAGNLLEVLDQVRFYFSNVTKANPTIAAGSPQRSTYLADLENKIAILSAKKFDGRSEVPAAAAENGAFSLHEPSASTASRRAHDVSPSLRMPRSFQYDSDEDDV